MKQLLAVAIRARNGAADVSVYVQAPRDYYRPVETAPASRAAIPVAESQCELLRPK